MVAEELHTAIAEALRELLEHDEQATPDALAELFDALRDVPAQR